MKSTVRLVRSTRFNALWITSVISLPSIPHHGCLYRRYVMVRSGLVRSGPDSRYGTGNHFPSDLTSFDHLFHVAFLHLKNSKFFFWIFYAVLEKHIEINSLKSDSWRVGDECTYTPESFFSDKLNRFTKPAVNFAKWSNRFKAKIFFQRWIFKLKGVSGDFLNFHRF